ncbi:sulfatase family protein [Caulifigura coniformis]|nr:sulfatase [Caulifigura coniformis]
MSHTITVFVALACALPLAVSASAEDAKRDSAGPRPNILLIVSEDNGPDLGCYGSGKVKSPNLDRLAESGMLFENAFVTYAVCSPSRSTILTGLYPFQNGQIGLATHGYRMFDHIVDTLPAVLKRAGYRTGCLGKIHVNPVSAIPFDFHPIKADNFGKKGLERYADEAVRFVKDGDSPFFLMVNFPDAHFPVHKQVEGRPAQPLDGGDVQGALPYVGANSERLREFTANYFNCMMRLDEAVGLLMKGLEATGRLDNTLIIYLGDHGAQFPRSKCTSYEAGLRVPMMMSWKGHIAPSQRNSSLISSIDLFPTILDAAGIEPSSGLPGISLLPFISGEKKPWTREYVFSAAEGSTPFWHYPKRTVRNGRYKLILNLLGGTENPIYAAYEGRKGHFSGGATQSEIDAAPQEFRTAYETWKRPPMEELYDLQSDPCELHNLAADARHRATLDQLKGVLAEWRVQSGDPFLDDAKAARYAAECREILERYPNRDYAKDPEFRWKYPDDFSR